MDYKVENLTKSYGELKVLDNISITFPDKKISVVLGPSGCGKTTLLNIIAGFDTDFSGKVTGLKPGFSSYVFQEDNLLPYLSVIENVSLILESKIGKQEAKTRAKEVLEEIGLSSFINKKPYELSGGMKRRVSLAQAFAYPSNAFLLDEPFSSLDLKTRLSVMKEFLKLQKKDGRCAIIVTHDVKEALFLADRIIIFCNKPSCLKKIIEPNLEISERDFANPVFSELEAKIYSEILY